MKKIGLIMMPLLALAALTNCNKSNPEPNPLNTPLCFTCLSEKATISFISVDKFSVDGDDPEPEPEPILRIGDLEYSFNGKKNWIPVPKEITLSTIPSIELKKDQTVYLRGDNLGGVNGSLEIVSKFDSENRSFVSDGELEVKGNVMSLISKNNFSKIEMPYSNLGCFLCLFEENKNIVDASKLLLPTNLSNGCFASMFSYCDNLRLPPKLDATQLANSCYSNMFDGCKSLEEAPYLPAPTLAENCYFFMFNSCTLIDHIKVGFGTPGGSWPTENNCTEYWLNKVSKNGLFEWKGDTEITKRTCDTVPINWEIKTIE